MAKPILRSKKQQMFVQEYLVDLNATQSAIRAGYSKNRADQTAYNLLRKTEIKTAIQRAMQERVKRTQITQDRVLKEYARIAFMDPRKFFNANGTLRTVTELDDDTAAALGGMDVLVKYIKNEAGDLEPVTTKKIKFVDKLGALRDVGKHLGMFEKDNDQRNKPMTIVVREMDLEGDEDKDIDEDFFND